MKVFDPSELKNLYLPAETSHKRQNGKLLIIGGSHLFHAASLWALQIASRMVDMVFYASVPENNHIVFEAKKEFRNGIVVPREDIENYIDEADCILIGPGMNRAERGSSNIKYQISNIKEINDIKDEGVQSYLLTKYLLRAYSSKKFVIDAGALQMLEPEWLKQTEGNTILTPHVKEFEMVFGMDANEENATTMSSLYNTTILLKGHVDIVASNGEAVMVSGGNAGMTKGGTGDVLAGLTASLYCKNDAFLSAQAASFFNKKAGESLFERVGYYFNASDLADEIPKVMKQYLL